MSIEFIGEEDKPPKQYKRAPFGNCCIGLGTNRYYLNVLIEKGYVKAINFENVKNTLAHVHVDETVEFAPKKSVTSIF